MYNNNFSCREKRGSSQMKWDHKRQMNASILNNVIKSPHKCMAENESGAYGKNIYKGKSSP